MTVRIATLMWMITMVTIRYAEADIVVVSDLGYTDELVPFIEANFPGQPVIAAGAFNDAGANPPGGWPTLAPTDLVVVSRHTNSGNYDDSAGEQDFWTGLPQPMLLCSAFLARQTRWNFVAVTGQGTVDAAGLETVLTPQGQVDPLLDGVTLSGSGADLHTGSVDSMIDDGAVGGGTVLARDAAGSHIVLARYPAGAALADTAASGWNGGNVSFGGARIYFGLASGGMIAQLTPDGERVLVNAITELLGVTPPLVFIRSVLPQANTAGAHPQPVIRVTIENGSGQVDTTSVALAVNGNGVAANVSQVGGITTISYPFPEIQPPLSVHTASLVFSDLGGPPTFFTNQWSFTVADWVTLTPEWGYPLANRDASVPGFVYRDAQHDGFAIDGQLPTTAGRAIAQLVGKLMVFDTFTGLPFPDESLPGPGPDGSFTQTGVINFNIDAGITGQGNFHEGLPAPYNLVEAEFPGIDGFVGYSNFATETITLLELTAGAHTLGVNSDDGFVVFAGPQPRDLFAPDLARFDGGRGSADTRFSVVVEEDGLYPVRLIHYQGGGGASLEFFSVDPATGQPRLINDTAGGSVPAWRGLLNPATPPYVSWVTPADATRGVPLDQVITVELRDGDLPVDTSSIALSVNGTTFTPDSIDTVGDTTTVSYDAPGDLADASEFVVEVAYGAAGARLQTGTFSFVTVRLPTVGTFPQDSDGLVVLEAENFTGNASSTNHQWVFGASQVGFSGQGYMEAAPQSGANINDPNILTLSPRLDYQVNFVKTGTHRVWVRGYALSGDDDSVHAGLDGVPPVSAQMITGFPDEQWAWSDGGVYTIEVPSIGLHTVNFWMREDGLQMDRIVVTSNLEAEPLGVRVTEPANGDTFSAGADITVAADAAALGADVTLIEFFEGTNLIGQASSAPFQIVWGNVPTGRYLLTAQVTDALGGQATSEGVGIAVGPVPPAVLYVLANPAAVNASDQAIIDRLVGFGLTVEVVDDGASQTGQAYANDLVIISSTVTSGDVGDKFQSVEVPVLNWEQAVQDNFWMTLDIGGVDHETIDLQMEVEIVDETHPLAAGFPNGVLPVTSVPVQFSWGLPTNTASVVATVAGDPTKILIYCYDQGAVMQNGNVAPARRVHTFLADDTYAALNADGAALVDAAISYALGLPLQPPAAIPLSLTRSGAELRLSWPADDPSAVLHVTTDLLTNDWQPVTAPVVPEGGANTVTITPAADQEHYRLQ